MKTVKLLKEHIGEKPCCCWPTQNFFTMLLRWGKVKGVHHCQALIIWNVKGTYFFKKRKKSRLWTVKWQQTHNCQELNLKQKQNKLSKQLEQEQNHRNGDHM